MDNFRIHLSEQEVERAIQAAHDNLAHAQEQFRRYARPDERFAVGLRIDPENANVFFLYGQASDAYGELDRLPEERCWGRRFFAVDPDDGVAVSFRDLPAETRDALAEKQRAADAQGWESLLGPGDGTSPGSAEDS